MGEPRAFDFAPKAHWDLGPELGILDFERAAQISGARFAVYWDLGARLERALIQFMLDLHGSRGLPRGDPALPRHRGDPDRHRPAAEVRGRPLQDAAGDRDLYLIPTAEVPLTNLHRDEILEAAELPQKYVAFTPCFRSEAGSYGKDVRGLIRQHQFHKVELVKLTTPESSMDELEGMVADAEEVLKRLGLPVPRGRALDGRHGLRRGEDLRPRGLAARAAGLPRDLLLLELHRLPGAPRRACATGRRPRAKPRFLHTLNGSGLAVGRTLIAVLENYQQADGSVVVPEALRPTWAASSASRSGSGRRAAGRAAAPPGAPSGRPRPRRARKSRSGRARPRNQRSTRSREQARRSSSRRATRAATQTAITRASLAGGSHGGAVEPARELEERQVAREAKPRRRASSKHLGRPLAAVHHPHGPRLREHEEGETEAGARRAPSASGRGRGRVRPRGARASATARTGTSGIVKRAGGEKPHQLRQPRTGRSTPRPARATAQRRAGRGRGRAAGPARASRKIGRVRQEAVGAVDEEADERAQRRARAPSGAASRRRSGRTARACRRPSTGSRRRPTAIAAAVSTKARRARPRSRSEGEGPEGRRGERHPRRGARAAPRARGRRPPRPRARREEEEPQGEGDREGDHDLGVEEGRVEEDGRAHRCRPGHERRGLVRAAAGGRGRARGGRARRRASASRTTQARRPPRA